jgi:hypothetical protein
MDPTESTKLALQHARELFIYHAGQRIQSLNFYFVAIAVFLSGFGFLASSKMELEERAFFGIVLACGGFYVTRLFQQLDERNHQLVQCDECLLKKAEERLAVSDQLPEWKVTERAEKQPGRHYLKIVPNIFGLYQTLSIVGGIYSIWPWTKAVLGFS